MRSLAAGWLLVLCTTAGAQITDAQPATSSPPASGLPEIVVTATRTRTRADDGTAAVTVISGDDLARRQSASVNEALRGTPGVDVTEFGSPGHSAFASIRGAAPDQVLVLLDGVEVNSTTFGQFDFADLPADNIDRIEILRGGGGALYGSEAIGGVINVLTQRGAGPWHASVAAGAGSAATHREIVGVSGASGFFALSGTASFLASDGFRSVNDDYRNFSTVWRADADLLPGGTLRGVLRYTNARTGLVSFNLADDGRLDPDAHSRSDFFLAKGEWEHTVFDALTYRAAASFVRDNERFRDDEIDADTGAAEPVVIAHIPSEIIAAELQVDYLWREWTLTTVGLDVKERSARIFEFNAVDEDDDNQETASPGRSINANRSDVAVYAQEQLRFFEDTLRGTGGVRYDHFDDFGSQVTWSGSGSYLIRPTATRLRVGYAEGFRAPTFDELFDPLLGNAQLQPERSHEINAGFVQDLIGTRLRLESTYFYRDVKNFIEEIVDQLPGPIAGVPEAERGRNLNARFQGVEVLTRARPIGSLTLWANYTYLNFVTPSGTLLNRPRHRGTFGATIEHSGLFTAGDRGTATVQVYAVGTRDSADPFNDTEPFTPSSIGSYARTDLALAYAFASRWVPLTLTAKVRNLFNRDYSESIGFPAPPASFFIGLRYEMAPP